MSTTAPTPTLSEGYDPEQASRDLGSLLKINGGRWTLTDDGKGIERTFKFKTFKKTWEFMDAVAGSCAKNKHHPEWSNMYNTTFIRWTTHAPNGLSAKDTMMARECDTRALICEEVESEESAAGKALADRAATEGGDCCVPKAPASS